MSATTTQPPADINAIVGRGQLGAERARHIVELFQPLYQQAREQLAACAKIDVTAADQVTEMKQARTARLALKNIRTTADKHRKEQKESALRESQAIQDVFNNIARMIEPEEERLQACEDFAIRAEAARKAKLRDDRTVALRPYGVNPAAYRLEEMSLKEFDDLLADLKARKKRMDEEVRQAAEARKADEEKQRLEAERLRKENERLRAEQEQKDEEARQERLAAQARADVERQKAETERRAREKAEAELRAKEEAEAKRRAAEEAERRRLAAAPDREKLLAFADVVEALDVPELSEDQAETRQRVIANVGKLAAWIRQRAEELGGEG